MKTPPRQPSVEEALEVEQFVNNRFAGGPSSTYRYGYSEGYVNGIDSERNRTCRWTKTAWGETGTQCGKFFKPHDRKGDHCEFCGGKVTEA